MESIFLRRLAEKNVRRRYFTETHLSSRAGNAYLRFSAGEIKNRISIGVKVVRAFFRLLCSDVPNAYWNRDDRQANAGRNDAGNRDSDNGARSQVKIYAFKDFIQPPSILPTSASLLCVWNIFVSFAMESSKNKRSFSVEISRWLCALRRYDVFICFGAFFAIISSDRQSSTLFSSSCPSEYRHRFSICVFISTTFLYTS